jgi:NADH dehydrogenase
VLLACDADLPCDIAVVCAGFVATPLAREAGLAVDTRGRAIVDASLRSVSHPAVMAIGDAGDIARMSCHNAVPTGAHAADVLARELRGRPPRAFDFGAFHLPISLGRRDGLIQFTHRDNTPRSRILTGRPAALYKKIVRRAAQKGCAGILALAARHRRGRAQPAGGPGNPSATKREHSVVR